MIHIYTYGYSNGDNSHCWHLIVCNSSLNIFGLNFSPIASEITKPTKAVSHKSNGIWLPCNVRCGGVEMDNFRSTVVVTLSVNMMRTHLYYCSMRCLYGNV